MNYQRKYDTDCNKYYLNVQHFFRVQVFRLVFRFRILFKGVQFIVQSVQFIFQGAKCIYTLFAFLNKVNTMQIATSILWIYSTFAECSDFFLILD